MTEEALIALLDWKVLLKPRNISPEYRVRHFLFGYCCGWISGIVGFDYPLIFFLANALHGVRGS